MIKFIIQYFKNLISIKKIVPDTKEINHTHELGNMTCGVAHFNEDGKRLPECNQCVYCGQWVNIYINNKHWSSVTNERNS